MAAVRVCRAFIPMMRQAGWGRIVLIGSEDAVQPYTDLWALTRGRLFLVSIALKSD